ncbi:MFS transporter [Pseudalkalibacillus berkeleyi]|uniref:MFS transporter n=1 Tax=Pseudalkalibacillus berkeleyi TaxID=1069813 RepID=A0ABS9H329_9BACL|nr:MFS transporter [Pseudalkalibacillus berkeleyi]MCF6138336.1 MFS transporter [Pseudalkalibacillus berkeleyi]
MRLKFERIPVNISLFYFFIFFGFGTLFPLLSVYLKQDVGLSGTQIGAIMSVSPVVMIIAQPIWGIICDYTRRPRAVLIFTLTMSAFIALPFVYMDSYMGFILISIMLAVFQSAVVPVSDSITLNYVMANKKDYGNYRLWGALGFAMAVYLMGSLAEKLGLTLIFYSFTAALLICTIFVLSMPKESNSLQVDLRSGFVRLIKMPKFILFLFTTFCVFGPIHSNNFYFGLYIQELGGTLAGVGLAFLLAAGSEAPFMKFSGGWIRKAGYEKILIAATLISSIRWFYYFTEPSLVAVYATTIAQGFSIGLFIPAALQYVRKIAPDDVKATAVALYSSMGNGLGSWFCTFIGGIIYDAFSLFGLYLFFGITTAVGLVLLLINLKVVSGAPAATS